MKLQLKYNDYCTSRSPSSVNIMTEQTGGIWEDTFVYRRLSGVCCNALGPLRGRSHWARSDL
jgi:hypothetical protein